MDTYFLVDVFIVRLCSFLAAAPSTPLVDWCEKRKAVRYI